MTGALNFRAVANSLLDAKLAKITEQIELEEKLMVFAESADHHSLMGIARILFEYFPPPWILNSIANNEIAIEYIPSSDLSALAWMGEDLTDLLRSIAQRKIFVQDEKLRKRLGDIGELVLIASNKFQGKTTFHVAQISDSYGYDIEVIEHSGNVLERIEVKASLPHTNGRIFISKNECEKARFYGNEWNLVQITFDASVPWKTDITRKDVVSTRGLSNADVLSLTSVDTSSFRWLISAEIKPTLANWNDYSMPLPENLLIQVPL